MKITSRSFLNVRQYAAKKKWSSTFPTSGKFASCFIDLPSETGAFVETHGTAEAAGAEMRKVLVTMGMMQDHRGAPKGNRNAAVDTSEPRKATREASALHHHRNSKVRACSPELPGIPAPSEARNLQKSLSILNANLSRVGARPIPTPEADVVGDYGGPVGETLQEANLRIAAEVGLGPVARAKPVAGVVVKKKINLKPVKNGKATPKQIKRLPAPKKKLIGAMKAHTKATKPKRSHHKKVA